MRVLSGIDVGNALRNRLQKEIEQLQGNIPHLAVIRVGERPDDIAYEKGATKSANKLGIRCSSYVLNGDISHIEFVDEFQKINKDNDVDGILLLRPLPKQINEKEIVQLIEPEKDIDCISPWNLAKVFAGEKGAFAPCTAEAVMEMLDYNGVDLCGKRVTVVGRSLVVGKPLAMLLLGRNATITMCHTRTLELESTCKQAEILIAAAGKARMIKKEHVAEDAIVIDVGINVDEDGKLCGDVDYEDVKTVAGALTPVPKGIGSITTFVLLDHLIQSAKKRIQ